jgi:hypothetical protein
MNNLSHFLKEKQNEIIAEAMVAMKRAHLKHYEAEGLQKTKERLKRLYDLTLQGVVDKNVAPLIEYIENVAQDRFSHCYDIYEVQSAINILEETIWNRILRELRPIAYADALGLISTILGIGKDTLARKYVSLASKKFTPYIDYKMLFEGFEGQ